MKTRLVHKHSAACEKRLREDPDYLKSYTWYPTGATEEHNAGGFGSGPYFWVVLECNILVGCPGKILVNAQDIADEVIKAGK